MVEQLVSFGLAGSSSATMGVAQGKRRSWRIVLRILDRFPRRGWPRMKSARVCIWWSLALAAACSEGGESPSAGGPGVTDSAGVCKVSNAGPLWGPGEGWRISAEPSLALGAVEAPEAQLFHRIEGVTRLSDGTIVVLDGGSGQLRAFDSSGRHLWSAGSWGDGPGELQRGEDVPTDLHLSRLEGDTLQIENWMNRIRWSPEGTLADHGRVSLEALESLGLRRFDACLLNQFPVFVGDEILVCRTENIPRTPNRPVTERITLIRIPWTVDRADTIGTFFVRDGWMEANPRRLVRSPLGPRGRFWASGREPKILYSRDDAYRIEVWDFLSGALSMIIERVGAPRIALTEFQIELALRWGPNHPDVRSKLRADDERFSVPDSISIVGDYYFDDLGFLWVLRAPVGDDEGVLIEVDGPDGSPMGTMRISSGLHDVFRSDGRYLGTVRMPHGLEKDEIGPDYVLGVTRDDLGVEFVRMFRLDRGGREPEAGVEE